MEKTETNKRDTIKSVVALVCGAGAWTVLSNIVSATTPLKINAMNKVLTGVGVTVLGSMLSDSVTKYTDDKCDAVFDRIQEESKKSDEEEEVGE